MYRWSRLTRDVTPTFALTNPIPPSRESLEQRPSVYARNCPDCHGAQGRGDGQAGQASDPPPADLRVRVTTHIEGRLYRWISTGFPGSTMPSFESTLSEEVRRNVLNDIA